MAPLLQVSEHSVRYLIALVVIESCNIVGCTWPLLGEVHPVCMSEGVKWPQ